MAELPGRRAILQVVLKVGAAGDEFALAYLGLEDQAEFAIGEPVVDGLDEGYEVVVLGEQEWL